MAKIQGLGLILIIVLAGLWLRSYKQSVEYQVLAKQRALEVQNLTDRNKESDRAIASLAAAYSKYITILNNKLIKAQQTDDSLTKHYAELKPRIVETIKRECPQVSDLIDSLVNSCENRIAIKQTQLDLVISKFDTLTNFKDSVLKINIDKSNIVKGLDTLFKKEAKSHKSPVLKMTVVGIISGILGYLIGQ